ncbi:putative ATP-dependent RNA helicase DDX31 [Histomonas meleagridis]|nr:putative ATP-dependent RNA helicase DDX31 [Histomonas meleagridis]
MLIIGNKVEKIGYYAFRNCENLKCITIPNSVIKIGDYAIQRCYSLETLTIGCNVSMIGERSLESNSNLTNIAILSPYISIKLVVSSYKKTLTTVIIGNNVTTIDDDAFSGFYTLKEINIGNKVEIIGENVKSIDNYAFMLCTNLHCINYYGEVEPRYKDNAFYQTNIYKPLMQILTVRFPTEVNPIKRSMGPLAIIICPTRELCLQTYSVIHKMNSIINFIVAGILIGGEKVNTEKKRIRKGINILITTPSRFLYHLHNTQNFKSFPNLQFLVLDEADRLLDLGFFKPITEIIESLPPRQTILISATLTEDLKALTNLSLNDPITIGVHTENQKDFSIPPQLQQRYLLVDIRQRLVMLALLLRLEITNARRRHTGMKSIVFINTCDSVDFHYHFFSFFDFKTDAERGHVPRLQYNEMQKRNKQEATIIDIPKR